MTTLEIYWDDLTPEAQEKLQILYHDNIELSPIAIINIEDNEQSKPDLSAGICDNCNNSDGINESLNPELHNILHTIPYQVCPKCGGQGTVSRPPYIAGDVHKWSSTSCSFTCNVCNGNKIIPMYVIPIENIISK